MTESNRKTGFSIAALDTYQWPVDVKVPVVNEDGDGDYETRRFIGTFRHLSVEQTNELIQRIKPDAKEDSDADSDSAAPTPTEIANMAAYMQIDLYEDIWLGWNDDLTDQNGKPLKYSDDMKRQLLGQRMIRDAVMKAYKDSQGGEAVRTKN